MKAIVTSDIAFSALIFFAASTCAAPAQTPEQLIERLNAAARQGDVGAYAAQLDARSRQAIAEDEKARANLLTAYDSYRKALDEKFGEGAPMLSGIAQLEPGTAPMPLVNTTITDKKIVKGRAELQLRSTYRGDGNPTISREYKAAAQREHDGWKLALSDAPFRAVAERSAAIDRVTRGIRAGEYPDRQAAMVALSNAFNRIGEANR